MPDVKPLTSDYLKLWVDSWSQTYPVDHDTLLAKLRDLPHFTIEQMAALVDWKYPPPPPSVVGVGWARREYAAWSKRTVSKP